MSWIRLPKDPKPTGKGPNKSKPDRILKAIKKYAKEQKNAMRSQVDQLKTERLKLAEENARRDSEKLIPRKAGESAQPRDRHPCVKDPGRGAEKAVHRARRDGRRRLCEGGGEARRVYQTDAYAEKLLESAREIAAPDGDNDCTVYLNEGATLPPRQIGSKCSAEMSPVEKDNAIRIGGVKEAVRRCASPLTRNARQQAASAAQVVLSRTPI